MKHDTLKCVLAVAAVAFCVVAEALAKNISGSVILADDDDWTAEGALVIESGATLDLAGHTLRVAGLGGEGTLTSSASATFTNLSTDPAKATCTAGIASVDRDGTAARVFDNVKRTIVKKSGSNWPFSATYDFETPTVVNSYKITMDDNNYFHIRAPGQWEIFGSNDNSSWSSIGKGIRTETEWKTTGKNGTASFELNNLAAYRYYKITITVSANQDADQGGYIEFWQLQFGRVSHGYAIVDDGVADVSALTVSGEARVALSGNITLSQDCDLRSLGTAAIIDRGAEITLNGHKLYANAAAFATQCTVKDAEISHADDLTAADPARVSPAAAKEFAGGTVAANLFNNNYERAVDSTHRLLVEYGLPVSIEYDFGEDNATIVDAYRMWVGKMGDALYNSRLPHSWKFEGKNDGDEDWTLLDKRNAEAAWNAAATIRHRTYTFDNSTAYRRYRITIESQQPDNDRYMELVQLEFFRLKPTQGELHIETTAGQAVSLDQMALAGNLRFFIEGAGTVYLSTTGQRYVGGTEICGGTVGGGVGLASLAGLDIFGEQGCEVVVRGNAGGTASAQNAVLGFVNRYGYTGYKYVLAGGTIQSPGAGIVSELRLSADSRVTAAENLVGGGYAYLGPTNANMAAYADLGGFTCYADAASGRHIALSNVTLENGILNARYGGWFATTNSVVATNNLSFVSAIAQDIGNSIAVQDYAVKNNEPNYNKGAGVIDVYGTFLPLYGKYFHGARLMDGSIVDFAGWDGSAKLPMPTVAAFSSSTTGAKTLLFDSGVTIGVKLGGKKLGVGTQLVSWDAATKPDARVKFKCADGDRRYTLEVRDDGLYYMGSGFVILFN